MTTDEMLKLFDECKIGIILNDNDEEIEALSEFFERNGYRPYELSSISAYIRDCLGERGWPNICIADEKQIQGCGNTYIEENMHGESVSIREFLNNDIGVQISSDDFDDVFTEV